MKRPIIALDFPDLGSVQLFLKKFPSHEKLFVKVGMELFYEDGPEVVRYLKRQGHDIFLDLKLHDIPNTVESGMRRIAGMGVAITNVHAAGGTEMMAAALRGLEAGKPAGATRAKLIAVTQLTSTSEKQMQADQLIAASLEESVRHYAQCAQKAGLDGVVCSGQEVAAIKKATDAGFICLTPGIRPTGAAVGDQKRVMTPGAAREIGADYIVVGRPITQAADPYDAYTQIKKEWNGVAK